MYQDYYFPQLNYIIQMVEGWYSGESKGFAVNEWDEEFGDGDVSFPFKTCSFPLLTRLFYFVQAGP
jgi:hypothetical protein